MKVSLTPELKKLVDEQVKSGLYEDASEVVRDALRHKFFQSESESEWLHEKLTAGLASPAHPVTEDTWNRIEKSGQEKLHRFRKKAA